MTWLEQLEVVGCMAYAMVLGGVIGFERELKDRPAGFRTHMLVAGSASLLIGLGQLALADARLLDSPPWLGIDPLRLVEAVVAGVAFIGAGTIFAGRGKDNVAGITTAASLLMVAVIGTATGFRYYVLAFTATVMTLLVLTALNALEAYLRSRQREKRDAK